jgi:hypothetical protein
VIGLRAEQMEVTMTIEQLDLLLSQVQKPARYTAGEMGAVIKTPGPGMLRYALCFPDLYEVGMSHLGMKILYAQANARPDVWCERVFAPESDMERRCASFPFCSTGWKVSIRSAISILSASRCSTR